MRATVGRYFYCAAARLGDAAAAAAAVAPPLAPVTLLRLVTSIVQLIRKSNKNEQWDTEQTQTFFPWWM